MAPRLEFCLDEEQKAPPAFSSAGTFQLHPALFNLAGGKYLLSADLEIRPRALPQAVFISHA